MSFAINGTARAALVVFLSGASVAATLAAASAQQITPPPGATMVREVQGGGAQVYACKAAANGAYQWTLVGPNAILVNDDGTSFGVHSTGPSWTAADGSSVRADGAHPLQAVKHPDSVADLLLKVVSASGNGALTGVQYVRRSESQGGLPPATGCDAEHANTTVARHYSALYTFYR
jgi:Protein of unknown function (DUF3455)